MKFDPIALAQELIQIKSLSGQEEEVANLVENKFRLFGFREVYRDKYGTVTGIIGPAKGETSVLFDGHLDVVPITGDWTVDPFGGKIENGRLYGRGATDMKGGLAAAICGVAAAADSGLLTQQVAVSASVMEEVIEGAALALVLDRLKPQSVVICEPTNMRINTGQRGRAELQMKVKGVPAHAAHPSMGVNPIELFSDAISELRDMVLPKLKDFGEAVLVPTDIISSPYPSISLIPGSISTRMDRRTMPGETESDVVEAVLNAVKKIDESRFDVTLTDDPVFTYTKECIHKKRFLPAWKLDQDHDLVVSAVSAVTSAGINVEFGVYGFCTNGSESAGERGIPTIGFGPGKEEEAHTADESVCVNDLKLSADVYRNIALLHKKDAKNES